VNFLINWGLPFFAALIAVLGLVLAGRGMLPRHAPETAFNVARLETRLARRYDLLRGVGAILFAALLLVVSVVWAERPESDLPAAATATLTPTSLPETLLPPTTGVATATAAATATASFIATMTPPPEPSAAATALPPASVTPSPSPSPTETAVPQTAVVESGVGVWLRADPSTEGEQLEWVLDGTVLTLLGEVVTTPDFTWQYVQTPAGNIGWVAETFILIGN
jgi:hypothetical protein